MFTIFPFGIAKKICWNKHVDDCDYLCEDFYNEFCGESLEIEDFDEDDVCSYYWFPRCVVMSSDEEVLMKDVKNNWEEVMEIAKTSPEIINYL